MQGVTVTVDREEMRPAMMIKFILAFITAFATL
jgi:hypothetical protein